MTRRKLSTAQARALQSIADGCAPVCPISTTRGLERAGLIESHAAGWSINDAGRAALQAGAYEAQDSGAPGVAPLSPQMCAALGEVQAGKVDTVTGDSRTLGALVRRGLCEPGADRFTYRLTAAGRVALDMVRAGDTESAGVIAEAAAMGKVGALAWKQHTRAQDRAARAETAPRPAQDRPGRPKR